MTLDGKMPFSDEVSSCLEAISKPQIAFEGKAGADDKAQHTREVCEHFEEALNTTIGR